MPRGQNFTDDYMRSGRKARQVSRAEGRLEVVAAYWPIQVEDLAREVKSRNQLAFHRAAVDFGQRDPARGHLGLGKAACSRERDSRRLENLYQVGPAIPGQFGSLELGGQPGQ